MLDPSEVVFVPPIRMADRILVLAAKEGSRRYHAQQLAALGYEVQTASEPQAGLTQILSADIDVVVVDHRLPEGGALALCRLLRRHAPTKGVGILLLGEDEGTVQRAEGLRAGADDWLDRRASPEELRSRVGALLRLRSLRRELSAEREQLRSVLDAVEEAVFVVDAVGSVRSLNRAAYTMFGLDPDVLRLRTFGQILASAGARSRDTHPILGSREPFAGELELSIGDERRVLSVRGRPLPGPGDDGLRLILFSDITAKRDHERLRDDFHSMIAHDLRNPVSVVQGYVSLLSAGAGGGLSEMQADFLGCVERKIREMSRLLDDFLDFSKLDGGFVRLQLERLSLPELLEAASSDLRLLAEERGQTLTVEIDPDLVDLPLEADGRRIQQVLQNLLGNALKYNRDGGGIRLRARAIAQGVQVEVDDDGPGIPEEERGVVFERWTRSSRSEGRYEGVGLGLLIVRKIVEAHGGRVGVESAVGVGSTFWFSLPCPRPPSASNPAAGVSALSL